jgi:hypothetical protein
MDQMTGVREERRSVRIRIPADVVDVDVREEDGVDVTRLDSELGEPGGQPMCVLERPVDRLGRPDRGVDEEGEPARLKQIARERNAPRTSDEEVGIERAIRLPGIDRHGRKELDQGTQISDRVHDRGQLA